MGKSKKEEHASQLGCILDLLAVTDCILEADTHDRLREIGERIKNDPLLNDRLRSILRLIFRARWQEIDNALQATNRSTHN